MLAVVMFTETKRNTLAKISINQITQKKIEKNAFKSLTKCQNYDII
jgi:hypothetical protein